LVSGTILENQLFGLSVSPDEEKIKATLNAASFKKVLSLPDGLNTYVG